MGPRILSSGLQKTLQLSLKLCCPLRPLIIQRYVREFPGGRNLSAFVQLMN
jgi:hypothetical protein